MANSRNIGFKVKFDRENNEAIAEYDYGCVNNKKSLINYFYDPRSQTLVIVYGKIYYLNPELQSMQHNESFNYAQYVLAGYYREGEEFLFNLEGEFALVILDLIKAELIALRDMQGCFPLYFYRENCVVIIGTSLRNLITTSIKQTNLDLEYFAYYLMNNQDEELWIEATPFKEIKRVIPGYFLRATKATVELQQYWTWEGKIQECQDLNLQDAGRCLFELLYKAVEERIDGKVSSHLSGGMDSTTISILAAMITAKCGQQVNLQTLTLLFERDQRMLEEQNYIKAGIESVLSHNFQTKIVEINADKDMDFNDFEEQPLYDEPRKSQARIPLYKTLLEQAIIFDTSTILTGNYAEPIIDRTNLYVANLVRNGQLMQAHKEIIRWANSYNSSFNRVFWDAVVRPFFPLLSETMNLSGYGHPATIGYYAISPFIKKNFAKQFNLKEIGLKIAKEKNKYPFDQTMYLSGLSKSTHWICWDHTAPFNVHIANPFTDQRIVQFCLGIPPKIKSDPRKRKTLLQEATQNVLPEIIRNRHDKSNFSFVYYRGLGKNLDRLKEMVNNSSIQELDIFDTQQINQLLTEVSLGKYGIGISTRLNHSLSLVDWYDKLEHLKNTKIEFSHCQKIARLVK
jgi:asparagine synthase (glutamine-hydrolysing)